MDPHSVTISKASPADDTVTIEPSLRILKKEYNGYTISLALNSKDYDELPGADDIEKINNFVAFKGLSFEGLAYNFDSVKDLKASSLYFKRDAVIGTMKPYIKREGMPEEELTAKDFGGNEAKFTKFMMTLNKTADEIAALKKEDIEAKAKEEKIKNRGRMKRVVYGVGSVAGSAIKSVGKLLSVLKP